MKTILTRSFKLAGCVIVLAGLSASAALAQAPKIELSHLTKLEAKASQVVDVTVDDRLIRIALLFLDSKKPDQAKVREIVAGLKGVYVKSFQFDKEGEYSMEDIESIRSQIREPHWSRIVGVRSKREGDNIEVFTVMDGEKIGGVVVIAAQPKQLTIVNIVGQIDLAKLAELQGNLGIPNLEIEFPKKTEGAKKP